MRPEGVVVDECPIVSLVHGVQHVVYVDVFGARGIRPLPQPGAMLAVELLR
jgi:hypothetical protein